MFTNVYNIMKGLQALINENRPSIDGVVDVYEPGKKLHLFLGMRKSIPADALPSLELEPSDASNEYVTTETQESVYSIDMMLTVSSTDDERCVDYICTLAREFLHLFNNPGCRTLVVPFETSWNAVDKCTGPTVIQFGSIDNVSYNSVKDGSLRVARWTWSGRILESYPRDYENYRMLADSPNLPRQYSPIGG